MRAHPRKYPIKAAPQKGERVAVAHLPRWAFGYRFFGRLGIAESYWYLLAPLPGVLSDHNLSGDGGRLWSQLASKSHSSLRHYSSAISNGRTPFFARRNKCHLHGHPLNLACCGHRRRDRILAGMALRWPFRISPKRSAAENFVRFPRRDF
jgi:hypothetical protein